MNLFLFDKRVNDYQECLVCRAHWQDIIQGELDRVSSGKAKEDDKPPIYPLNERLFEDGLPKDLCQRVVTVGAPMFVGHLEYWIADQGYVILAIPERLKEKALASGEPQAYECPVSVKYVAEHGYSLYDDPTVYDSIVVDIPYSEICGAYVAGYDVWNKDEAAEYMRKCGGPR